MAWGNKKADSCESAFFLCPEVNYLIFLERPLQA